jgi:Family of unknown function (DUF6491)
VKKTELWVMLFLSAASPAWLMAGPRADDAAPTTSTPAAPAAPASAPIAAPAAAPKPAPEARIQFANQGGIWDWDVVDSSTLLIQDRSRRWYKAKLLGNCYDLPFEQKIGFESNPNGSFDKFSAIQTRQQRCPLFSLTRTDAPAKKTKKADANGKPAPGVVPAPPAADVKSLN